MTIDLKTAVVCGLFMTTVAVVTDLTYCGEGSRIRQFINKLKKPKPKESPWVEAVLKNDPRPPLKGC